ncbi:MAG: peptide ABC transporter [Acetobacteraceae bacterium]|nr:peptide ABC transporter [Acetobacteraceae bacterium]
MMQQTNTASISRRALLAAPAIIGLAAVGTARAEPKPGGALRVAAAANPSSLDPFTGRSGADHVFLFPIFDRLIDWEPATLEARPGIAEFWSFTDPRTLVLSLRSGVRFHDGTACDAAAVKANLERGMGDTRSSVKPDLGSIDTVEASGADRVILHLKQPDTSLPLSLSDRAGMMFSPAALAASGTNSDRMPVGTGPWKFVQWDNNNQVILTRNPDYWRRDLPYLDGIQFKIIPELNTGLRSVVGGQNDLVYQVPSALIAAAKRDRSLVVEVGPSLSCNMLYFNYGLGPMAQLPVRQAINYAIDRAAYSKLTTSSLGEAAGIILPSQHWAYDKEAASAYPFDPAKAKQLLADAGFAAGVEIPAAAYSDQFSQQRMEIIMGMLEKVGIKLTLETGTVADLNAKLIGGHRFGFNLSDWSGRPDPSVTYASVFESDAFYNEGKIEGVPGIDAAIVATRQSSDLAVRKAEFAKLERLERSGALFAPLAFAPQNVVHSPKVQGYVPNLLGKPRFDTVYLQS